MYRLEQRMLEQRRLERRMAEQLERLIDTFPILAPHLRANEKRKEWLYKHLLHLRKEADPELTNHLQALEEALPNLLATPPACLGIGGDGQIFCSESMDEIKKLLRENSPPPWLRIRIWPSFPNL